MMFARREPKSGLRRAGAAVGSIRALRRAAAYCGHRLLRLRAGPHAIAFGAALGVLVSFTPIFGARTLIAVAAATPLGANPIAAAVGTYFGNPLVYPALFWLSFQVGCRLTGLSFPDLPALDQLGGALVPALLGLGVVGMLVSLAVYAVVRAGVFAYQGRVAAPGAPSRRR